MKKKNTTLSKGLQNFNRKIIESGITRYTSIASSFLTNMKYCERTRMKDYSSEI